MQGPEHKFSCVRLGSRTHGAPKLLGETYVAKIRAGVASLGSSPDVSTVLQEAFGSACGQLSDCILMPETCAGAEISRNYGQVTIASTQSQGSFVVPECECIFLLSVAPEIVAKWLLEAILVNLGFLFPLFDRHPNHPSHLYSLLIYIPPNLEHTKPLLH